MSPLYDKIETINGIKFIRLKGGRLVSFYSMLDAAKKARTQLSRHVSRAFKLAGDEYDLEQLEWFVENLEHYLAHIRKEIEKRRGIKTKEERIALMRNTSGRTPEEAEAFNKKADELERKLREES